MRTDLPVGARVRWVRPNTWPGEATRMVTSDVGVVTYNTGSVGLDGTHWVTVMFDQPSWQKPREYDPLYYGVALDAEELVVEPA